MAKKRAEKKPRTADERVAVIVLKGSPEYREWLAGVSRQTLIPIASIVRDALKKWAAAEAKLEGYPGPPDV